MFDFNKQPRPNLTANWVKWLSPTDRNKLYIDMVKASCAAIDNGRWDKVHTLLEDWKATAEAEHDPVIKKKLAEIVPDEDYTGLDIKAKEIW